MCEIYKWRSGNLLCFWAYAWRRKSSSFNESTDNAAVASACIDRNINSMSKKFDLIRTSVQKTVAFLEEIAEIEDMESI